MTTTTETSSGFQFIVDRTPFVQALTMLGSSISKRSTLPILENVCIIVDSLGMEMSTTDLEIRTSVAIENHTHLLEVASIGMLTVGYKELLSLVKSLKDEELYCSQDGYSMHIDTDLVVWYLVALMPMNTR